MGTASGARPAAWPARRRAGPIFPPEASAPGGLGRGAASATRGGAPASRLKVKASITRCQWRTIARSGRTWKSAQPSSCLAGL